LDQHIESFEPSAVCAISRDNIADVWKFLAQGTAGDVEGMLFNLVEDDDYRRVFSEASGSLAT
jgi:hypothetical protein